MRREERIPVDPGFLHVLIALFISRLKHVGTLDTQVSQFQAHTDPAVICSDRRQEAGVTWEGGGRGRGRHGDGHAHAAAAAVLSAAAATAAGVAASAAPTAGGE